MHIVSGDLWAGAEVQAYTLLKYLQPQVRLHVVVLNEGELVSRLRELNIPVTILLESQLGSFTILKKLAALIRELRPDIIHTHRQKENILGGLANFIAFPLSRFRPRSIRTTHGAQEFTLTRKHKLQVWVDEFVGSYLQQAVIAVSDDLANKLLGCFPRGHVHVVHNGVDCVGLQKNRERLADGFSPAYTHIGIVGRLEPVKRVDIFIQMASLLLKNQTSPHLLNFHIIGDGSLMQDLQHLAKTLGVASAIQFHGHCRDAIPYIRALDIIVMCSDHEGTPMTALESLALGVPLLGHDVGGLHELLQDQPHLRVVMHSPVGYANAVLHLLSSNLPAAHLASKYTAEFNASKTLGIYQALISRA